MMFLLALLLTVTASGPPDWQAPAPGTFPDAKPVTGVVQVGGVELRASADRLAAFVGGVIRGVASPTLVGGRRVFQLSVAGGLGDGAVSFKAYDSANDRVIDLNPTLPFDNATPVGTLGAPFVWTPVGEPPAWIVDTAAFEGSMTVTAVVLDGGTEVGEAGTRVGAFVGGVVRGAADVIALGALGSRAFLQVYGDVGENETVTFRVLRTGPTRVVEVAETVPLNVGGGVGTVGSPFVLTLADGVALNGESGWRMLAPPGGDTTPAAFLGAIWTQGFSGADASNGDANVYRYDEPTGDYIVPASAGESWPRGTGRYVYVYADDDASTAEIDGGFPKILPRVDPGVAGPFTFALTRTSGNGEPEGEGWNLLGNPFDQAIDWDLSWVRSGVSASIAVWDPAAFGGSYQYWNGTVGSLTDGVIPAGNAFWARATTATPTLSVPEAAQVGTATVLGRTATAAGLRLLLASDDRPEVGSEWFLSFQPESADNRDDTDATMLAPLVSGYLLLGSVVEDALLAIDARPGPNGRVEIPLAVSAVDGGASREERLRLLWSDVAVAPGWHLVLVDTETDAEVDLRQSADYAFVLAETAPLAPGSGPAVRADGPARFVLRVTASAVAREDVPTAPAFDAPWPNPARTQTTVSFTLPSAGPVRLALVDMLGQTVAVVAEGPRGPGRHSTPVAVDGLAAGVYVLWLDAGGQRQAQRLTVLR